MAASSGMVEIVAFVHEGLGNSSYLLGVGEGRAVLVDPDRNADRYLTAAEERGWRITDVVETHLHADFVSGALEVREAVGATLRVAEVADVAFPHVPLRDGERLELGEAEVEARATPSHTPEHLSFVVRGGTPAAPPLAFTGGALIVGGAARTDLIAPEQTDQLTRSLYRVARRAFDDLPDETVVLPTHGGGSFCSAGAGRTRTSTLGAERAANSVLTFDRDEDAFASWFPSTFPGTPAYYARMRAFNAAGPRPVAELERPAVLNPLAFAASRGIVLDVRPPQAYANAHVPGSLAIPFRDSFAVWLGWLAAPDADLFLVSDGVPLDDVLQQAWLVGYERFGGVLDGGMETWVEAGLPVARMPMLSPADAAQRLAADAVLVDVREPSETARGTAAGALSIPLGELVDRSEALRKNQPVIVTCGVGERSTSAASILEREGFTSIANLAGGMDAWRSAGLPVD